MKLVVLNRALPALLMVLPATVYAEHAEKRTTELEKVTVTAPATSVQLLDSAQLSRQDIEGQCAHTSDTASLLGNIAGLSLYGGGGVSSLPSMRGLADDRLRIKVDGMDLISACANHMNPPLSYVSPGQVSNIKVYSGVSPVSAGGDSIGGSIIVESSKPVFAQDDDELLTKGEAGVFYRSNGDVRGANLAATLASERISINYTGSFAEANNYEAGDAFKAAGPAAIDRGFLDADEVGSSAYQSGNHAINIGYQQDKHLFNLKLGFQDIPFQGWPNQRMDMVDNRSYQINLDYTGSYDWGTLETLFYHESTNHRMQFGDDKQFLYGTAMGMPMETDGDNTGLAIDTTIMLSKRDVLRLGINMQRYRLDDYWEPSGGLVMAPNTFININNGQRDRYGIYGEWEANWNPQWLTLAGVRYENVRMDTGDVQGYSNTPRFIADANSFNNADRDKSDHNVDVTLLTRYSPTKTQTYELGFAQKTRSPNLYERYAWSSFGMAMRMVNLAGDGNGYVGNVNLEQEVARTISFTADWHDAERKNWNLSVTPYLTYVNDYIDAQRCSPNTTMMGGCTVANQTAINSFVYLRYQNVDARIYGVDVSGYKQLYRSNQFGTFTGNATLSYLRGKNRDSGDNLYNMMPLNATVSLEHAIGQWHSSAEVELVSSKDRVNSERNEVATSGYSLFHLRSGYEWKQARFDVGIENVFDRFYSHPLSGAYLGQGMTMPPTGVPWGVTVPGVGRSYYAGLTLKF